MNLSGKEYKRVLLVGSNKLAASVTVCLLRAGHDVVLFNSSENDLQEIISQHLKDLENYEQELLLTANLEFISQLTGSEFDLVICIVREDLEEKQKCIARLERIVDSATPIAINSESISLQNITARSSNPDRIIGMNWAEPAHTSLFLEMFSAESTDIDLVQDIFQLAKQRWQKDPYLLKNGRGIRSRLLCALLREAFYLVENNYVRVEDIDRACRNDAGYYLPFAGNFRYMDLMGAYMYGIVMQDLNPELSKDKHIPEFCRQLFDNGAEGMSNGKGFYNYENGEAEEWSKKYRQFSYEIKNVISKYHHETVSEL